MNTLFIEIEYIIQQEQMYIQTRIFVCVNYAHVVNICMGVVTVRNFRDIKNMPYISPGSYLDLEKCYRFIRSDL